MEPGSLESHLKLLSFVVAFKEQKLLRPFSFTSWNLSWFGPCLEGIPLFIPFRITFLLISFSSSLGSSISWSSLSFLTVHFVFLFASSPFLHKPS